MTILDTMRSAFASAFNLDETQVRSTIASSLGLSEDLIDGWAPKFEKADPRVQYRDAETIGTTCGDCRRWAYGECAVVEGTIDRNSVCDLFQERPAVAFTDGVQRVFLERALASAPEWIPLLPAPGTFEHPGYGTITIDVARNERFVEHLRAHVYQDRIPVDAEHETKLSGAVAWIVDARLNPNGSADARVEWTERGRELVESGAYRYVSPEWYDAWTDPATGSSFRDVLIGAAITTRPFFKPPHLRSLVAREDGQLFDPSRPTEVLIMAEPTPSTPPETNEAVEALRAELQAERDARLAAEGRVASLEAESRDRRFTEEVQGRSASNGHAYVGSVEEHVGTLRDLASAFGEDSEQVRRYMTTQRSIATQAKQSSLFAEIGSRGAPDPGSPDGQLMRFADELRATNPALTKDQAIAQVYEQHPELRVARRRS